MWDDDGDLSQVVAVPNPAAGSDFEYDFPGSEYTRLRSVCFTFDCSAAAASRLVRLKILDGSGAIVARMSSGYTIAAGVVTVYTFALDMNVYGANSATSIGCPLVNLIVTSGFKLESDTSSIQTGDQIKDIRLVVDQVNIPGSNVLDG